MKKNPLQTEATKQKLQSAFWDIYEEKSFKNITVREITERAQVNRSTFYAYYKDVYDILEQSEDEILANLGKGRNLQQSFLAPERYNEEMRNFGRFILKNRKPLAILLGSNGDPKFSTKIWNTARQNIYANIMEVAEDKNEVTIDYITEYIVSSLSGVMIKWLNSGCDLPFEEISSLSYRLMLSGVMPILTDNSNPYDKLAGYIVEKLKESLK